MIPICAKLNLNFNFADIIADVRREAREEGKFRFFPLLAFACSSLYRHAECFIYRTVQAAFEIRKTIRLKITRKQTKQEKIIQMCFLCSSFACCDCGGMRWRSGERGQNVIFRSELFHFYRKNFFSDPVHPDSHDAIVLLFCRWSREVQLKNAVCSRVM